MPWSKRDATKHTKGAASAKSKGQWAKTANAVLRESGDEGKAIRIANAAISKRRRK